MKYFLFSDVHGEYDALITSLEAAGFDLSNEEHILVGLGDYFDRGSQNEMVLVFLKTMLDMGRIKLIRGNHDDMLLSFLRTTPLGEPIDMFYNERQYLNDIIHNGMNMTIAELAGQPEISKTLSTLISNVNELRKQVKEKHPYLLEMLKSMTDRVLIDNYVLTHAGFTLYNYEEMKVDNWAHTETMVEKLGSLLSPHHIYIFGHWHAEKLNRKFKIATDNMNKFIYKNFIGIDGKTNFTKQVTIHIIESSDNIF